uniref:Uncharacterized protein n=1 Tax=Zea mays TaxID=4577 RepID=C0PMI5_MAIZE|nr:unknown [Zea mays]
MAGTESESNRRKEAAHQEGLYFTETAGVLLPVQSSEIRNTRNGRHTTGLHKDSFLWSGGVPVLGLRRRRRGSMHGHAAVVRAVDQPCLGVPALIGRSPRRRLLLGFLYLHSHSLQLGLLALMLVIMVP